MTRISNSLSKILDKNRVSGARSSSLAQDVRIETRFLGVSPDRVLSRWLNLLKEGIFKFIPVCNLVEYKPLVGNIKSLVVSNKYYLCRAPTAWSTELKTAVIVQRDRFVLLPGEEFLSGNH